MLPKQLLLKPLEVLAGRPYPDIAGAYDPYDSMSDIQAGRSFMRREFAVDVLHLRGVGKMLEFLAGEPRPDILAIRQEVAAFPGTTDMDCDYEADYYAGKWRDHLIHLDGLRKWINERRGVHGDSN